MTLTSTMQVFADENLLAVIMGQVGDPQTLFNLILSLPVAKAAFESCPRQLLIAALSSLPPELQQLAILCTILVQNHITRGSMTTLLLRYLSLDDTPGLVSPPVKAVEFVIPENLSDAFETLRKVAAVWSAVEDLASGFVRSSVDFIGECKAAEAAGRETVHYERGHRLRPLSHLWNRSIQLPGLIGSPTLDKPQPWSLPLRASEIYRVKRALWRLELFAIVSRVPHTSPNKVPIHSESGKFAVSSNDDEGTRMLLASMEPFELAELETVYDYLWRETIGKVYRHKLDPYRPQYNQYTQQGQAEREAKRTSRGLEQYEYDHAEFEAQCAKERGFRRARKDHDRYLAHFMSRGLSFLHRVLRQMARDRGEIIPDHYPPMRYRSLTELRETWNKMDRSRGDDGQSSYNTLLRHVAAGNRIERRTGGFAAGAQSAIYLLSRVSRNFRVEDLWRLGCYMWESDNSIP